MMWNMNLHVNMRNNLERGFYGNINTFYGMAVKIYTIYKLFMVTIA